MKHSGGNFDYSDQYAGDVLYKQVISEASKVTQYRAASLPGGCFVAGTLVHTKNGLVPIEKIQVGDWVLSQPEQKGDQAYKRVKKTFVYNDKEIVLVRLYNSDSGVDETGSTGNHPFWIKGIGWTRADALESGAIVELQDGTDATILSACRLSRTPEAGIGWAVGVWGIEENDGSGTRIDFRGDAVLLDSDASFNWIDEEQAKGDQSFRSRVYNLEVDDFHTYYVGTKGVWVHNINCKGVRFADASVGLRPGNNTELYTPAVNQKLNLTGPDQGVVLVLEKRVSINQI